MLHSSVCERAAADKVPHFYDPAGNTIPIIYLTTSSFSTRGKAFEIEVKDKLAMLIGGEIQFRGVAGVSTCPYAVKFHSH